MKTKYLLLALATTAILSACSEDEKILPGERVNVRTPLSLTVGRISDPEFEEVVYADILEVDNLAVPIALPEPQNHPEWTQLNGNEMHQIVHPTLRTRALRQWSINIGDGNNKSQRITASPVFGDNQIFTMDAKSSVSSHNANGQLNWSRSLVPVGEQDEDAAGGGLAYANGVLYVTTGFGELYALNSGDGNIIWTQEFNAPTIFAPSVKSNLVFVVTQDGHSWGIDTTDGRFRRHWASVQGSASIATGATPAIRDNVAIIPYTSGEIQAVDIETGSILWSTAVGGSRETSARSGFRSITSAPVIDGNAVYVGNQAGRMVAIDIVSGDVLWSARDSSFNPVWPVGGSIFLVSDTGELVRLDADTGERIWGVELPLEQEDTLGGTFSFLFGEHVGVFANYGPILANGQLLVASSDGQIRFFDPVDGQLLRTLDIGAGAAVAPIISQATLYVVDESGNLTAYR